MATNEVKIPIPARLYNASEGGHVAGADQIIDDTLQKDQATINQEVHQSLGTGGSVDSRISAAVATETTRAQGAESTLQTNIDTEAARAQAAEADRYTKSETYTKEEVNGMITTPNQEYVSVEATEQTTAATDVLPATGAADTIYRVANWDGSQYDASVYSEYTWNTSTSSYIKLSTKNVGIDDEPTAGSDNLVKSGGVSRFITNFSIPCKGGDDITQQRFNHLIKGRKYRLNVLNVWNVSTVQWGKLNVFVKSYVDDSTIAMVVNVGNATPLQPYYTFVTSDEDGYLDINVRGDAGESVKLTLETIDAFSTGEYIDETGIASELNLSPKLLKSNQVFDKIYQLYDGKYVTVGATLLDDNNWFVMDFKLDEPIKQNDEIVWSGITIDTNKIIAFCLDDSYKKGWSATGDSRTFTVGEDDAAIGSNVIRASFLKTKAIEASVLINGVECKPVTKLQNIVSSSTADINVSQISWERGTITPVGGDYSNNIAIRTPNNAKIPVANSLVIAKGFIGAASEYVPDTAYIQFLVRCFANNGVPLGNESWKKINSSGYCYQLPAETQYIRMALEFFDSNRQPITLTDSQVTSIISNISDIINVSLCNDSLMELRKGIIGLQNEINDADAKPTKNSNKLITSSAVYEALNPVKLSQYAYLGAPINLKTGGYFDASEYMTTSLATGSESGQGCVNWNEKLLVGGARGYIRVFNLETKENLGDVTLASAHSDNHLNNICFGAEGDANNTNFPKYLYASEANGHGGNRCFVENFTLNGSTLVQTIDYVDAGSNFYYQWVVDSDNNYLYCSIQTAYPDDTSCKIIIKKFPLPAISDGASIELTDADVLSTWEYDGTINYMYGIQGIYYFQGKFYLATGGYDNGQHTMPHRLFVIDLLNGDVVSLVDMAKVYEAELEAVCIYKDKLLACYPNQHKVYELSF